MPVSFFLCVEWSGIEEKERKNESGSVLAGQSGMEIVGLRKVMWAGTERFAAKGCCRLAPGGK